MTALTSDLGHGTFDGSHLVANFENLNPANTLWTKYYDLWSHVDTKAARFLDFETWWGSHVNLAPIRMLLAKRPELPQVACFDTAFHRSQSEVAQAFALPPEITQRGVRRYGFHGLSYEYIASILPQYDARAATGRTVVFHLGNGASMCGLHGSKSVATTMGFTALDGLPMGTRCGNLDPGVVLYLMDELKMDAHAVEKLLYQQSGLLGLSGVSSDMRAVLASGEPRAKFAVELFTYRIGRELGSLTAALGGLDALVFTAGIGEHAPAIRERVCQAAAWLGVELDPIANSEGRTRISTDDSQNCRPHRLEQSISSCVRSWIGSEGHGRPRCATAILIKQALSKRVGRRRP